MNVQYCLYGCSGGSCQVGPISTSSIYPIFLPVYPPHLPSFPIPPTPPSGCAASLSLTTPADVYQGDWVGTTVTITNVGASGGSVTLNGYLCRADGSNCQQIYCGSGNSMSASVYVPPQSAVSVVCGVSGVRTSVYYSGNYPYYPYYHPYPYLSYPYLPYTSPQISSSIQPIYGYSTPYYCDGTYYSNFQLNPCYYNPYSGYGPLYYYAPSGSYRIRVDWGGCGVSDPTIYSGAFAILPYSYQACTAEFLDSYRCDGNWRQQLYRGSDCSTYYRNVNFCSYGCSDGQCKTAATATTTTTTTVTTTTTTSPTQAATATVTTTVYVPYMPGLSGITAWLRRILPSTNTLLVILLILLIVILVILVSESKRRGWIGWRGEEEKFTHPIHSHPIHSSSGAMVFVGNAKGI